MQHIAALGNPNFALLLDSGRWLNVGGDGEGTLQHTHCNTLQQNAIEISPPSSTPDADSMYVVTGEVPMMAPIEVETASTIKPFVLPCMCIVKSERKREMQERAPSEVETVSTVNAFVLPCICTRESGRIREMREMAPSEVETVIIINAVILSFTCIWQS